MANRIMGLVGPGQGPWIQTHVLTGLRVKISGLTQGWVRVVFLEGYMDIFQNGWHNVSKDEPMCKVEYDGPDKSMVCTFLSGATRAVPQS